MQHPPLIEALCRSAWLLFQNDEKQERHEERERRRMEMEFVPKTHWDDYYREDDI